jgi:hypothetical protein
VSFRHGRQDACIQANGFLAVGGYRMFLALFFVLLVMWILGFAAFHVAGGLIHILLVLAVISILFHLVRGRPAV